MALLAAACLAAGCTPGRVGGIAPDRCGLDERPFPEVLAQVRAESEGWLRLAELRPMGLYDATPVTVHRRLVLAPGTRPVALLSKASAKPGSRMHGRSFLYDDALALLWYTYAGDEAAARGLAAGLVALQNDDGTWGFSFSVEDGFYNAAYVRMGTVGWVAHALATYVRRYPDPRAEAAAVRATQALLAAQSEEVPAAAGLVEGGRGRWSSDGRAFYPEFRLREAITEHQLDAHMALAQVAPRAAALLGRRILSGLWLENEGRFAVAADSSGPHPGRALDSAGGWGALWLAAQGDEERARRSLGYTVQTFAAQNTAVPGFRPFVDPIEGSQSAMEPDLIFVEGTLGVGLAAHRLGEPALAEKILRGTVALACAHGPGVPYANRPAHDFSVEPSAASTLWFLFLEREMRTGQPAPVFPPLPPGGTERGGS